MRSMYRTLFGVVALVGTPAFADPRPDVAMYGNTPSRNHVSAEKGLPAKFDMATGLNVKWSVELGSQSYAGPVVASGVVLVGTNNQKLYNPKLTGDRGNVIAFRTDDGQFLWQSAHAKLGTGRVNDWPLQGVCSTPYIDGERVWYVSNRAEVICADLRGFHDGENDGPFTTEAETSKLDEDVIWKYDMIGELDVFPHNLAAGNPLIVDDILYTVTGQGVDESHLNIPAPQAPSFIAVNRNTGELVWESNLPGERILHGSWSNPSYGVVRGQGQVFVPGGDGWLYSFEPKTGKLLWKFDLNPPGAKYVLGGRGTKSYVISTPVFWEDRVHVAVGQDPEHGEGIGNLSAVDVVRATELGGDVSGKAAAWQVGGENFHRTLSTVAIADGLLYAADLSGFVYCFDAKTGKQHWKYDTLAAIWGSPFVADGKVYIGDEDGDVAVLRHGTKMELLFEGNLGTAVYTTPVAKDGVLYIVSRTRLFALKDGIPGKAAPAAPAAAGGS